MPRFSLKFTLALFKGLMGVKRALALLFLAGQKVLERLGRFLARFFVFPAFKLYLTAAGSQGFKQNWLKMTRQRVLYFLILLTALILAGSETNIYASGKYLSGRHSLLFNYLGPGEDGETVEEGLEDITQVGRSLDWSQGALTPLPSALESPVGLEELSGPLLGDTAMLQPSIISGAEIGPQRSKIIKYVVQPGDAISNLSQKFQISQETILVENRLHINSILRPGDVLNILPVSGLSHKVKKGETIKKIAAYYRADTQKIIDFNHLTEGEVSAGEILVIPEAKRPVAPVMAARPALAGRPAGVKVSQQGMLWPTTGRRITQYFKWRHPGIDIALPTGNPIYASESGAVELSGWNSGGYGYTIIINHGKNLKTRYAHASKLFVAKGESVNKGDVIALIGSTGRSTGPHLHFEVIVGGVRVNPFMYVR